MACGIGKSVRKVQVLTTMEEDLLWSLGLLGMSDPETLLNTLVFVLGKGCAIRAGKVHHSLRRPPHNLHFQFLHDDKGQIFVPYSEDAGLKTNKGGLKHCKLEPNQVDVYPIGNEKRCPIRILIKYLAKLPKTSCPSLYLQPRKKYTPFSWYQNRPAGENRLREVIKDLCKKAGIPGFYTNHSLRSTATTKMYRANIDEQLIMEITGHHSLAVRSYKRTCYTQIWTFRICCPVSIGKQV